MHSPADPVAAIQRILDLRAAALIVAPKAKAKAREPAEACQESTHPSLKATRSAIAKTAPAAHQVRDVVA